MKRPPLATFYFLLSQVAQMERVLAVKTQLNPDRKMIFKKKNKKSSDPEGVRLTSSTQRWNRSETSGASSHQKLRI